MRSPKLSQSMIMRLTILTLTMFALGELSINAYSQSNHRIFLPLISRENLVPPQRPDPANGKWVSAYYTGFQHNQLNETVIDWSTLTHIIVGRLLPQADGTVNPFFDRGQAEGEQMAKNIAFLAHQNNRKALLMVGGEGQYEAFVAATSNANRATFVKSLIKTMDTLGYDGLDIAWLQIEPKDQFQVRELLYELRVAKPNIILTMPVSSVSHAEQANPFFAEISYYLNQINMMSYGMSDKVSAQVGHTSPLEGPNSISQSVDAYIAAGISASKLGVGTGFYGQCWKGVTQPGALSEGAEKIANDNEMSYTNIFYSYLNQAGSTRTFDAQAKVPYISAAEGIGPLGCNYISYEDAESIALKGKFVHDKGLGGTSIWTINQGFLHTVSDNQHLPLMQAVKEAFLK